MIGVKCHYILQIKCFIIKYNQLVDLFLRKFHDTLGGEKLINIIQNESNYPIPWMNKIKMANPRVFHKTWIYKYIL